MKTRLTLAIPIGIMMLLTPSSAQQIKPVADPEAERILDKASLAQGSDKTLGTLRTIRVTGSMYYGSSNLLGDVESIVKYPDKFRDTFRGTDGATLEYGFDGTAAWKRSSRENSTGLPRVQLLAPAAQWRLRYTEASFVGERKVGKHRAYVVRASVRGQTSPADYYYDPVSYLLLQVDTSSETLPITYRVSHFQDNAGFKFPYEWSFGENRTVIKALKVNVDIGDEQFSKLK